MKKKFFFAILHAILMTIPASYGHSWSEQMKREISAKTPDWLSIGTPVKVNPTGEAADDQAKFRPISGDSQSTRDRVTIPGRGIEIKVDYPISWYRGSSLSPDGTKLIINSGTESYVYEIMPNGSHHAIELRLPRVTFDAGPKGFIAGWSWADNNTLIGEAEIDNQSGEFIEKRIYVFYINENILSRLDISALNLPTTEGLTVQKVGLDLDRLKISVGNTEFTVKADLRSPSKIEKRETDKTSTITSLTHPKQSAPKSSETRTIGTDEETASSTPWLAALAIIFAAIGVSLLWLLLKNRK